MNDDEHEKLCEKLHEEACADGKRYYTDPRSGFMVFTKLEHLARGRCCRTGCRHCPYGFLEKPASNEEEDEIY